MRTVGIGAAVWTGALVVFCAGWYLICAAGDFADGWRAARRGR